MDRVVFRSLLTVALSLTAFVSTPALVRAEEHVDPQDLLLLTNPPTKKETDNTLKMVKELPVQVKKGKFYIRTYSSEKPAGQSLDHNTQIKTELFIRIVDSKTIMPEIRISF
jgi:hypothetical protein